MIIDVKLTKYEYSVAIVITQCHLVSNLSIIECE